MEINDVRMLQVVSEPQIETVQVEQGSDRSDEVLNVYDTLGKLEAQLQKHELLNSHFASQIATNSTQIQKLNEEIRSSLQLIFQELKDLKLAQSSKKDEEVLVIKDPQNSSSHALNSSLDILGSAPLSCNGSVPPLPSNESNVDHSSQSNLHTSSFLHHKSMKLEFPVYDGSNDDMSNDVDVTRDHKSGFFSFEFSLNICLGYGNMNGAHKLYDAMFEKNECGMCRLVLVQNGKTFIDKAIFIFDPGGGDFDVGSVISRCYLHCGLEDGENELFASILRDEPVARIKQFRKVSDAANSALRQMKSNVHGDVPVLMSGAGHDAMTMSHITKGAMLFVRCRGGFSTLLMNMYWIMMLMGEVV